MLTLLLMLAFSLPCNGQGNGVYRGCEGGMMIHTGFLSGNIEPIGYKVKGAPIGVGGFVRVRLGDYVRVGAEGYMSKLGQMDNGSFINYGWGGILCDFYLNIGEKFFPFAGLTVGGGASKDYLLFESDYYYESRGFFALDPFVGCELQLLSFMRLSIKLDFLNCIGGQPAKSIPMGPRLYFGFVFTH